MAGIEVVGLDVAGLCHPLSLSVPTGVVRAVVIGDQHVARAVADAVTGITPTPAVTISGPAHRRVRLVPSDGALLPHLTVLQNILAARPSTRHTDQAEQEVRAKAAGYGLDGLLDRYPHEIPVGRRRMTGLARALQGRPNALVIEDDPATPSWGALLATAWRGYQVRPDGSTRDGPRTPELLAGVATLLIVPTVDRATAFDADPIRPACQGKGGDQRGVA